MHLITAVLALGAIFATLKSASGTLSKGKGDDNGRRYVRVTSIYGLGGYDHGGYDHGGYDHGGYGYGSHGHGGYTGGYSAGYGGDSYGPSYGSGSHGPVSHYTDIIIKENGSKGHKGFLKGLKGLGKGFSKGIGKLVNKGKGLVGLDDKYELVGVLRPKHHGGYGDGLHSGAGGAYYDHGYTKVY